MTKYFEIDFESDVVKDLQDKFSYAKPEYATSEDELKLFKALEKLDDNEKIIAYALAEYHASRKIADALGTNNNYASKAVKEIREKLTLLLNN